MRKKVVIQLVAMLVLVVPIIAPIGALKSPLDNLEGTRIWIWTYEGPPPPVYDISINEPVHVLHGWNSRGQYPGKTYWSEFSGKEKAEFIRTSTFELFIAAINDPTIGEQIKLKRYQLYASEAEIMNVLFYIQFEPGDLEIGSYSFTGHWYSEVNKEPQEFTWIVTVHVS
ncbi:MAG: hypothetical protein ACXAEU_02370 [Candidatus Hodarchaeales archaeon]|jgi:hypothetical protein